MDMAEAKEAASKILPFPVTFEKRNGVCLIRNPEGVCVGMGPSWKGALRHAYRPIGEAKEKELAQARDQERLEQRAAAVEGNQFADFLRAKFGADFDAWKLTGGKRTSANAVVPGDYEETSAAPDEPTPSNP